MKTSDTHPEREARSKELLQSDSLSGDDKTQTKGCFCFLFI